MRSILKKRAKVGWTYIRNHEAFSRRNDNWKLPPTMHKKTIEAVKVKHWGQWINN
jgi:hypothetical protein